MPIHSLNLYCNSLLCHEGSPERITGHWQGVLITLDTVRTCSLSGVTSTIVEATTDYRSEPSGVEAKH